MKTVGNWRVEQWMGSGVASSRNAGRASSMPLELMVLGDYRFSIDTAAYDKLTRTAEYRWARRDRIGRGTQRPPVHRARRRHDRPQGYRPADPPRKHRPDRRDACGGGKRGPMRLVGGTVIVFGL